MTIKEQSAYLKGMFSGLELDEDSGETKLLKGIIDLLHNMSSSFENLEEDMDGVLEQLEILDSDLSAVECKVGKDNCECKCCSDNVCYEVVCPQCKEKICLCEETLADEEINCPNCGELLEFDLEDLENDCCSCGCDCECDCEDDCDCNSGCGCNEDCECSDRKTKEKN